MSIFRRLGQTLGVFNYVDSVKTAYNSSLGFLASDPPPKSALSAHHLALVAAFLTHDEPRAKRVGRKDAAMFHLLPFIAIHRDAAVEAVGLYVRWRNQPGAVNVGRISKDVENGLKQLERDSTGLREIMYDPLLNQGAFSMLELLFPQVVESGWGRLMPPGTTWGAFVKGNHFVRFRSWEE